MKSEVITNPCLVIARNSFPNGAFDFIGGGCGAICIIFIAKSLLGYVRFEKVWNMWIWLGRNSLIILCLHLIELNMIPWNKILNVIGMNAHLFIPILILKITWAIGGTWIINRTKLRLVFNIK